MGKKTKQEEKPTKQELENMDINNVKEDEDDDSKQEKKTRGRPKKTTSSSYTATKSYLLQCENSDMGSKGGIHLHLPLIDSEESSDINTTAEEEKKEKEIPKKQKKNDDSSDKKGKMNEAPEKVIHTISFFDVKTNKKIEIKTGHACWYCAHTFQNSPCYVPEKYINGIYYVHGNFCSYNCGLAYVINNGKNKDSIHLIKKLYSEITDNQSLFPSAPNILLKMFGGDMTIEEYRKNNNKINLKTYIKKIRPMNIELTETNIDNPHLIFS